MKRLYSFMICFLCFHLVSNSILSAFPINLIPQNPNLVIHKDETQPTQVAPPSQSEEKKEVSLNESQSSLLSLLNQERTNNQITPLLYLDDDLNELAQTHSEYMVTENFYSHYTKDRMSPSQRARQQNFTYPIRQVIQKGEDLDSIHKYLVQNRNNYKEIVDPQHTRVGIGMAMNPQNLYIITLVFSTRDFGEYPYTEEEVQTISQHVVEYLKDNDKYIQEESEALSTLLGEWIGQKKQIDGIEYLQEKGFFVPGKMAISSSYVNFFPKSQSLAENIESYNFSYFLKNNKILTKCGVGVSTQPSGIVEVWVFYTS